VNTPIDNYLQALTKGFIASELRHARILQSIDPSSTDREICEIKADLFSIALAALCGDNERSSEIIAGLKRFIETLEKERNTK
jgi:hypothetical protein